MHFRLILSGDFEVIVPQEGRIVQFMEISRNSLHILANYVEISMPTGSQIKKR